MTKPKQPQDMSKEKTFEERFDEEFPFNSDAYCLGYKEIYMEYLRKEILKVIGRFEVEGVIGSSTQTMEEMMGYNRAVKETNSLVKELRKEYEVR